MDDMCANCLRPIPDHIEGLFCSEFCKETAKDVRYFRRVFRDGRIDDPDVQEAVRTRVAFLAIGGYSMLERTLTPSTREAVKSRDNRTCRTCGKSGNEIDHIAGSSNDLSNLQVLCASCHRSKTMANMTEASPAFQKTMQEFFASRVEPELPALLADDEEEWATSWRRLKKARRDRFRNSLEMGGMDLSGLRTWSEWIEARDDWFDFGDEGYGGPEDFDGGYGPDSYFARAMARDD